VRLTTIKPSVINTFKRVGIPYEELIDRTDKVTAYNRFGFGDCETTPLIAYLIQWVYSTNNAYERNDHKIKVADFDRIRYFVADQDSNAYMTCLD
jgi:hypothetical protein